MNPSPSNRFYWVIYLLSLTLVVSLQGQAATREKPGSASFFGLTNLWTVELRFTEEQWKQVLKAGRASSSDLKPKENEWDRNYAYARADLKVGAQTLTNIGIRLKGSGTRVGNGMERWPFRIDLEKYSSPQRLDGVAKISFNNNHYDSSYLREAISYDLFRSFGVPAPRSCFIKLYLTVPGKYDRKYLGLYNAAEAVETPLLKTWFNNKSGLLLKPNTGLRGDPPSTLNWDDLARFLHPKTKATAGQRQKVVDFFKLIGTANDVEFQERIRTFINLEEYLRFLVVNVALVNQDSYLGMGKNYYIYLDGDSGKLNWLPWDLDLSMAGYFFCGTPDQRIDLSINQPSSIKDPLIRRVLKVPEFRAQYHELMREFLRLHFQKETIVARIDLLAGIVRDAVKEENSMSLQDFERCIDGRAPIPANPAIPTKRRWILIEPGLKLFTEKRIESIEAQLDGRKQGVRTGFQKVEPW